ncbi:MAG: histidine kinase [Arthrobacter sp.]|jgi:signal transduction histidine kinase|nr:histidine kinase [Arthrobacter sp.]
MNRGQPSASHRHEALLDAVVDLGFFLLLVVSSMRYFAFHPWRGEGIVVALLALGMGVAYALSLPGRWGRGGGSGRAGSDSGAGGVGGAGGIAGAGGVGGASKQGMRSRAGLGVLVAAALWMPLAVLAPSFGWCAVALILRLSPMLRSRLAWTLPAALLLAEAVGLLLMTRGQDPGLVLGALFAGSVLAWAVAALGASLRRRSALIDELRMARLRLAEAEREAGAAAERDRLAGELHDTVVQRSAGALMLLETTILTDAPAPERTVQARDALREALRQARALLREAEPGRPVIPLRQRIAAEAQAAGTTLLEVGEALRLPSASEHALLRATQEGLSNVAKHVPGALRGVTLRWGSRTVSVEVLDAGPGIDPRGIAREATRPPGGDGLRASRARLGAVGGTLRIDSAPERGTRFVASVPVPAVQENEA